MRAAPGCSGRTRAPSTRTVAGPPERASGNCSGDLRRVLSLERIVLEECHRDLLDVRVRRLACGDDVGREHRLIKTMVPRYVQAGGSLMKLGSILGHSATEVTLRYTHLQPGNFTEQERALVDVQLAPARVLPLQTPRRA